jgi:acyl carrier protein
MRPRVIVVVSHERDVDVVRAVDATRAEVDASWAVHFRFPLDRALAGIRSLQRACTIASIGPHVLPAAPIDGIHLGGTLRPMLVEARATLGPDMWISVPAHTDADIARAAREGATAVYVSPIFETPGKSAARGLAAISAARAIGGPELLLYALGGVDATNAEACVAAGADGVAVIRAFFDAESPSAALGDLDVAVRRAISRDAARNRGDRSGARKRVVRSPPMVSYDETLKITTEILKKHVDGERTIRPNDHIQNDLGLDSLGVMELVADIEDRFAVTIPNDVLSDISTVDDVAKALVKLKTEPPSAPS